MPSLFKHPSALWIPFTFTWSPPYEIRKEVSLMPTNFHTQMYILLLATSQQYPIVHTITRNTMGRIQACKESIIQQCAHAEFSIEIYWICKVDHSRVVPTVD